MTLPISKSRRLWWLFLSAAILSAFFAFLNLSEFVAVAILKRTSAYPFGGEGPTPWFYKTASLYATLNLIMGSLFLLDILFSIWAFTRRKDFALLTSFMAAVLLITLQVMQRESTLP